MRSIKTQIQSILEEKKSVFYGFVFPIASEEEAQRTLKSLREAYPQAAHVCYAYVLDEGVLARASDDGEPKHTAGLPMLGVLQKQELTDVLAVVVRIYGGIKLGASGLVRAYTKAVSQSLLEVEYVEKVALLRISFTITYAQHARIESWIQQTLEALEVVYDVNIHIEGTLLKTALDSFKETLQEKLQSALSITLIHERLAYR